MTPRSVCTSIRWIFEAHRNQHTATMHISVYPLVYSFAYLFAESYSQLSMHQMSRGYTQLGVHRMSRLNCSRTILHMYVQMFVYKLLGVSLIYLFVSIFTTVSVTDRPKPLYTSSWTFLWTLCSSVSKCLFRFLIGRAAVLMQASALHKWACS